MALFDVGEPFGGRADGLVAHRRYRIAEPADLHRDAFDQVTHLDIAAQADEAEHAGLAHRTGPRGLARPEDHQPR